MGEQDIRTVKNKVRANDRGWSVRQAESLYQMDAWADGYFFVNGRGRVAVDPSRQREEVIDVYRVVHALREQGATLPLILRFQDVLRGRVRQLNEAFAQAIAEFDYPNGYTEVYPLKVNQMHQVVDEVLDAGAAYGIGLECGSKAELVAALGHLEADDRLLICNGHKDADMLGLILRAQELGKTVIPVIEKCDEFERLFRLSREMEVRPRLGVRVKLSTSGAGKWAGSSGDAAKFGMEVTDLLQFLHALDKRGLADRLELLHFHLGSQIPDIQTFKQAVREATQIYVQLRKRGMPVRSLDVGGGLGINYEAGYSSSGQSVNYTIQEYANSVVWSVQEVCEREGVPAPRIISESGRAVTAHHVVLAVEVIGAHCHQGIDPAFELASDDHSIVTDFFETLQWVRSLKAGGGTNSRGVKQLLEAYHDALETRQLAKTLFSMGYLPLEQKARAERLYWSICRSIDEQLMEKSATGIPAELRELSERLVDQYLCDFSVFQSILDHWAIGQPFPIMPLHRLDEAPTRRAVLVDLTCDSDGKVSHYVSLDREKRFLEVHPLEPETPYYVGFFLTGAYQDIMGDVHNLFGRLPEAHVYADANASGGYTIEKVIPGASVQEMLARVQYFPSELQQRMKQMVRQKVEQGALSPESGEQLLGQYSAAFEMSTYFNPT